LILNICDTRHIKVGQTIHYFIDPSLHSSRCPNLLFAQKEMLEARLEKTQTKALNLFTSQLQDFDTNISFKDSHNISGIVI